MAIEIAPTAIHTRTLLDLARSNNARYEGGPAGLGEVAQDPARLHERFRCAAAECGRAGGLIDQQLLGECRAECLGPLQQHLPHVDDAIRGRAVDERAGRVDGADLIARPPAANRIEVLERIAEREEVAMA